jgi:hypothetical protein
MEKLIESLQNLLVAGWEVVVSLLVFVVPWAPLIAWVAFWLLAVNWEKLYPLLVRGGAIAVMMIGLMMILVWGLIAPPQDGVHYLFGLKPSNFVGKTIYVTMLMTIAALCGSVQLSGACGSIVSFPEKNDEDHVHGGHDHGHGHGEHTGHAGTDHVQGDNSHAH